MIKVSFIVPVYKVEKYIRASVESMLAQSERDIEIILVDDGSPDASGAICDEFAASDNRVKVIHKQNEGTGYARNTGFEAASGDYVYFCDPDDILEPTLVSDNYALAKKHNADIVAFGFRKVYIDGDGKETDRSADIFPSLEGLFSREEFAKNYANAIANQHTVWTKIYRRSFLTEHRLYSTNQQLAQDVLLVFDIYSAPFERIYYNHAIYYNHILRPGSATTRYRPNRWECEFNSVKRKEKLINSFAKYGIYYKDTVSRSYVSSLNMVFGSFSIWSVPKELDTEKRLAILRDVFSHEELAHAVDNAPYSIYKLYSPDSLIKLFMFKHRMFKTIVLIGRLIGRKHRGT